MNPLTLSTTKFARARRPQQHARRVRSPGTGRTATASSCFLLALFALCTTAFGTEKASPKFTGTSIPAPPEQTQPWEPPQTKLPSPVVKAIADLFAQGLADPRGCEYREIEVATGSCWVGDAGLEKTAGWVLPGSGDQRFAVCWNGLVYPVASVGKPADLERDVEELLRRDQQAIEEQQRRGSSGFPLRWYKLAISEGQSISRNSILPMKTALLLRLGYTSLAEKVWSGYFIDQSPQPTKDPYLLLAEAWAFSLFDRALCAHMRSDDRLALLSAQALVPIQSDIEKQAADRGLPRQSPVGPKEKQRPYLSFLDQLPALVADQERRSQEQAYTPILQMGTPPNGPEKIAGLIRDLELVFARQWGQPGGINLAEDPIVNALIHEGDPAVEPLLECLERDTRLTRSVRFWRDFNPSRTVLGVHEAAYVALAGILKTSFFAVRSTGDSLTAQDQEGRSRVAAQIRSYWLKNKGVPLEERWYRSLADDNASPDEWMQAADNIVERLDIQRGFDSNFGGSWTTIPKREPGKIPPMRGEPLRGKSDPSVAELLLKRMKSVLEKEPNDSSYNLRLASKFARALADWDGKAQSDQLHDFSELMRQKQATHPESHSGLIESMVSLYQTRSNAGDPRALEEYADWVVTCSPAQIDDSNNLAPLWRHPENSACLRAAEKMFGGNSPSPWVPLIQQRNGSSMLEATIFTTPLIGLPGFRAELLRGLGDQGQGGTVKILKQSQIEVTALSGFGDSWSGPSSDPSLPPEGKTFPFRKCDLYAFKLSAIQGFPSFQLYWPENKKNKALTDCVIHLRQYGSAYAYIPDPSQISFHEEARFHIPKLDHPATAEEVQLGRAIFSLEGKKDGKDRVRVCRMPPFPIQASWVNLKDHPFQSRSRQPDGTIKTIVGYATNGQVWQAEEVLVGKHWKRFYGFVGVNHLAKVPASDIEFPPLYGWTRMAKGWDYRIAGPETDGSESGVPSVPLGLASPLPITVNLRNRSGMEQPVPAQWIQPSAEPKHLPKGAKITIYYSSKLPEPPSGPFPGATPDYAAKDMAWEKMDLLPWEFIAAPPGESRTLQPTEETILLKADLRDFAKFDRIGSYRVVVELTEKGTPANQPADTYFTLHNR